MSEEKKIFSFIKKNYLFIFLPLVLIISFFTYFNNYTNPQALFWDENYYIPASQKYIDNIFFLESHPPLGKMLMALSETALGANKNIDKSSFTNTDFISSVPDGYNFAGVRFPSVFFGFLSGVIFFLILYKLFGNPFISFLFSFLYLFDNTMILQFRGAMLDGQQMFFVLLSILYFVILIKKSDIKFYEYLAFGAILGVAISIKANSLIFILLVVFLLFFEYKNKILKFKFYDIFSFLLKGFLSLAGILAIYLLTFYIHFAICYKTIDNPDNYLSKYYVSDKYKNILENKQNKNPLNFPIMFKDYLSYMERYHKNVPRLDLCKPGENGSLPIGMPLGIKSINYRWEKNDVEAKYLYLQCNPVSWLIGLCGFLLSFVLISSKLFFKNQIKNFNIFKLIIVFFIIYILYMSTLLSVNRVMYLYHYFIPLILTFILSYLIFIYIYEELINTNNSKVYISISIVFLIVFLTFLWFSPLTYYLPINAVQFKLRAWLNFWQLNCVN